MNKGHSSSARGSAVILSLAVSLAGAQPAADGQPSGDAPAPAAAASSGKLEVCADPNNLPFSNRAGEGFENRLAEIWASELGLEVEYTWFPHRRGFERHTLTARDTETGDYLCDVIVGVPQGYDLAMTTAPYYRSTYALVYVADSGLDIDTADDLFDLRPATLDALRIGVFTPGPAADWLALHGMHRQMVPFPALQGDPDSYPGQIIERELLSGRLDAAILWGPIAGYFAARAAPREVVVVPLRSDGNVRFEFAVSAGVRFGDRASRALLEEVMTKTSDRTTALLEAYHVPVVAVPPTGPSEAPSEAPSERRSEEPSEAPSEEPPGTPSE